MDESMTKLVIPTCTQSQAKANGEFILSRAKKGDLEIIYRQLKKKLTRGTLKYFWIPKDGYCLYYFDKKEV